MLYSVSFFSREDEQSKRLCQKHCHKPCSLCEDHDENTPGSPVERVIEVPETTSEIQYEDVLNSLPLKQEYEQSHPATKKHQSWDLPVLGLHENIILDL